jgi:septal ring-binding cell division protein DamX
MAQMTKIKSILPKMIVVIGLGVFTQSSLANGESEWACDQAGDDWNCAAGAGQQALNKNSELDANKEQYLSTNGSTGNSVSDVSASSIEASNLDTGQTNSETNSEPSDSERSSSTVSDQNLDSLARPSKFPAGAHSIPLLASGSKDKIIELIKRYRVPSLILEYTTDDRMLYLWVAGTYYSNADAQLESEKLPTLPENITPWIRPSSSIAEMPVLIRAKL